MRKAIEALPKHGWEWDERSLRRNPYLQEVRRLASTHGITISGNDMEFDHHLGIDPVGAIIEQGYGVLRKRYSYAIPTPEALEVAASCGPLVEIGAGKGYWAAMLSEMGVDVMPYDVSEPKQNTYTDQGRPFTEIFVQDAEIVAAHPDRTLFLCWPPLNDDMASRALSIYLKAGGCTLIYVGESAGGCTGDDAFFEIIDSSMVQRPTGAADVLRWWGDPRLAVGVRPQARFLETGAIAMSERIECSLIVREKMYRGASCVVDGSTYEIEARCSSDGQPYDEDVDSLDCRIIVDGIIELKGPDVWDLGKEIGESPSDEPIRYLEQFLRRCGEEVDLVPPAHGR